MKVPISEVDDSRDAAFASGPDAAPARATDARGDDVSAQVPADDDADEQARVEAAIRAGEQAAEEELKVDADRIAQERDELRQRLAQADDEAAAARRRADDAAERLVRLQADWDNFRRRTAQERLAEKSRAAEKLVLSLLPVLDDMERACEHAEQNHADDAAVLQFVEGVEAIHDKMYAALNKEGVEVIDPVGEPFDPTMHQAIGREEDASVFDDTVSRVFRRGYRMGGKVIRSAMVTVSFGGGVRPVDDAREGDAGVAGGEGKAAGETT